MKLFPSKKSTLLSFSTENKVVLGAVILFMVVVLGLFGVVFAQNQQLKNELRNGQQTELTPAPIITAQDVPTGAPEATVSTSVQKKRAVSTDSTENLTACQAGIKQKVQLTCSKEVGYTPGLKEWNDMSEEEREKENAYWTCYDRETEKGSQSCDVANPKAANTYDEYWKCMGTVNTTAYCGEKTGYTQQNGFPKNQESAYWVCIEDTREAKEKSCSSQTGYSGN